MTGLYCCPSAIVFALSIAVLCAAARHEGQARANHGAPFTPWLGNFTRNVDTRIGTGGGGYGIGQDPPGAQVPFGVMRLGPDTSLGTEPYAIPFLGYGGYWYDADYIECFSHTHLVGAGLGDLQNFGVTVVREWNSAIITNSMYRSKYSHDGEIAVPGYYAVSLQKPKVRAEVTVSGTHSGIHRYTCRNASSVEPCYLLVDVCHAAATRDFTKPQPGDDCKRAQVTNVTVDANGVAHVTAWLLNQGSLSGNGFNVYFHGVVAATGASTGNAYALSAGMWIDKTIVGVTYNETTSHSLGVGLQVVMGNAVEDVVISVRTGISFISTENAEALLYAQQQSNGRWMTFEEAQIYSTSEWEGVLSRVDVMGSTTGLPAAPLTVLYTAVYHSHCAPSKYTEFGAFLGEDGSVHQAPDAQTDFMSDLSIWDVYRTQMPLIMWTAPKEFRNTVWSMLQMYYETNQLPKWVLANQDSGCMVGHHSAIIMSDAVRKGMKGLDALAIFNATVAGIRQEENRYLLPYYYVPFEGSGSASSHTLDYAVDAGAVLALAQHLGRDDIVAEFRPFAGSYRNLWDNETLLFCPRWANGTFTCPADPTIPYPFDNGYYTEGDAVQYRWYVPHDLHGLVELFPSPAVYSQKLNDFFADTAGWIFGTFFSNPQFWAGNEPDILAPVQFAYAGNQFAYLVSEWFPRLLWQYETPNPQGLPGNDDFGALSAWAVWGYLGIYPVSSTNDYVIFTPQFQRTVISIPSGGSQFSPWNIDGPILEIVAHNHPGPGKPAYLANASINGVPLSSTVVPHDALLGDGNSTTRLDLYLSDVPTVFGMPAPGSGGPMPWIPEAGQTPKRKREDIPRTTATLKQAVVDYLSKWGRTKTPVNRRSWLSEHDES